LERKESLRLKTLHDFEILNTPKDEFLNNITELASRICKTPISSISLLDDKRVWYKTKFGFNAIEAPKDISFCQYTIEENVLLEVKNALEDERFKDNPYVKNEPWFRFYAGMPLTTQNGSNLGTLCVMDIQERELNKDQKISLELLSKSVIKQMELQKLNKELKIANEFAEKCSKAKDEFLSNMSHELRTPLNAIYGYTEILSKTKLSDEQREMVSILKNSGEVLLTLINDILDIAKIESGKVVLDNQIFDLNKTVLHIKSLLKQKCEVKGVEFRLNIDHLSCYILKGDKVRLTQILINLIGNSIKFTSKGFVSIDIKVIEDNYSKTKLLFSVKDSGIGIEEKMLSKVFERFEQASTDTVRKYGGTGLGLSISKSLVELQGGELKIKSKLGEGTEFYFELAFNKSTESEIKTFISECKNDTMIYNFKNLNVLVFEDNPINIKLISKILKDEEINFKIAENGKIGVDILKDENFDIIFMDLQMPVMNGYEATKYIRNILKLNTPILAMTANCSEIEKTQCLAIGMNDYLSKPFKLNVLYSKIGKLLNIEQEPNFMFKHRTMKHLSPIIKKVKAENLSIEESKLNEKLNNPIMNTMNKNDSFIKTPKLLPKIAQIKKQNTLPSKQDVSKIKLHENRNAQVAEHYLEFLIPKENVKLSSIMKQDKQIKFIRNSRLTSSLKISNTSTIKHQDNKTPIITKDKKIINLTYNVNHINDSSVQSISSISYNKSQGPTMILRDNDKNNLINKTNYETQVTHMTQVSSPPSNKTNQSIHTNTDTNKLDPELTLESKESKENDREVDMFNIASIKIYSSGDVEFEKELINEFLKETPIQLSKLKECIDLRDYGEIKKAAHKMKSSVDMFGLRIIKMKLIEIMENSIIKNINPILQIYNEIQLSFKSIFEDLNKHL